ncbi:Fibrinogen-like protein A [Holothuria leucospilota]|uniref:Fibrinogen-like protein A n=1 Tax=Holothuria leucospilota TaxID=206669 RepID=A0A9Q1CSC4_HOLLE|nr:Fibrinogen-like protein A [Holothuria leucospilota]
MGISLYLERLLFLLCMCVYNFGYSSDANSRDSGGQTEEYRQGLYFFYQTPEYPRDCREVRDQCSSSISSGVYLIKPDGYPKPFEVYCNNDIDSGGWTVIQRRVDGSLDFRRNWEDYKNGFGFLSSEFWVGNERLSYLTNQNVYELRTDIFLSNNASFYISYNLFRINDEWGKFALAAVQNYTGDADSLVTFCSQNMVYGNCTCIPSCQDPLGTNCQNSCDEGESCVCQEGYLMDGSSCVFPTECGCYLSEDNRVLRNGETYVNVACTEKCICNDNQLNCDTNYRCSQDAVCNVKDDVRQCYCNDGYTGDGETCTLDVVFRDCNDVRDAGNSEDDVYSILPSGWPGSAFNVFCNMSIDGGGWTVFQRRNSGATGFYRNWASYKNGFGDIQDEFWLGNDKLHYMTQQGTYELRVDFVSSSLTEK